MSQCRLLIQRLEEALSGSGNFYFATEFSFKRITTLTVGARLRDQPDCVIFDLNYTDVSDGVRGTPYIQWADDRAVVAAIDCKARGVDIGDRKWKGQIYDYQSATGSPLGFLTNFEDVLCLPMSRQLQRLSGGDNFDTMEEIANWIAGRIKEYHSGIPQPQPIERISGTLKSAMQNLLQFTKLVSADLWEDILHISALEDEELYESEEERLTARYRGAAFVALAQILFYIIFRHSRIAAGINRHPELKSLNRANGVPSNLESLLRVLRDEINFKAIYRYEVLPLLPDSTASILRKMVHVLEGLSHDLVVNHDLIGQLFQTLIPERMRKRLAAYYTKPKAAELLSRLTILDEGVTVLDPACGSGTLLVHAYHQKKRLQAQRAQHEQTLAEIFGSDMSPFATILASVNLAIQNPEVWTNQVNIFNANAFDLPQAELEQFTRESSLVKRFMKQTPDGMELEEIEGGLKADIILANPPFTRGSRLPTKTRRELEAVSKSYGIKHGWRDWNLYSFFILLAPKLLTENPGSRVGLVLPYKAISTKHMESVWKAIFTNTTLKIKYMIIASDDDVSFSESSEQEILIILETNYKGSVKFLRLKGRLDQKDIESLAHKIEASSEIHFSSEDFDGSNIMQQRIEDTPCRMWPVHSTSFQTLLQRGFVTIDEISFVKLWAEVAPKPADYFWIPNRYWSILEENNDKIVLQKTPKLEELIRQRVKEQRKAASDIKLDGSIILNWKTIPDKLTLQRTSLVKSFVRKASELYDEPPYLGEDYPHTYFVIQANLDKQPNNKYHQWGQLLRSITTNWVVSPPKRGLIFIPSKIRLNTARTLAYRTPECVNSSRLVSCIFTPTDMKRKTLKNIDILYAYLTSSIFLLDFIRMSRQEAEAYRKMHATDIRTKFRFPNITKLDSQHVSSILKASNLHNTRESVRSRPTFLGMIQDAMMNNSVSTLRNLDLSWLVALGIPSEVLPDLYNEIIQELSKYPS